ncbi:MAG: putative deoxyribonuclease RhsC [Acinetobacter bereziniae]|uniref:Putative deoxyribonuclease RhsC n=1 Tax=Acinetobacter bereziniae TaxID=106648 RepID=A0A833PDX6_ACIBZ|nr:MAG: putative deoxyribonuclease RhsC [Acinetobacter bereziniae]
MIDPIATQTLQVKNNLITQYQGKHYKYDAQGNVIETTQSGQTLKLTWDNLNRLIQSDHNGQITNYGYDVFGRRLFKKNTTEDSLTLFGWDGDLMIWESYKTNSNQLNKQDYTKHYVYEPNSFVPLLQTGYTRFIQLIETPDYRQFQDVPYSIYKDPVWKTETRKNKAELERVAFYHCDQVGTPQTLSNELGECIWEIKQDTWGTALEIKATEKDNPFGYSNIRFQGQYYDKETGLHYNRYRYYEPYSARYVSKDPIGLNGGFNLFKYVRNPQQLIDPLGLVEWSGSSYQVSGGPVSGVRYELRSECVNGRRARIVVYATGGTEGKGLAVGAVGSESVSFEDGKKTVDPGVFNGTWSEVSAGVSFIKGIAIGKTELGTALSQGVFTFFSRGYTASAGYVLGVSKVTSQQFEDCRIETKCEGDCKKKRDEEMKRLQELGERYQKENPSYLNVPPSSQWFPSSF